MLPNTGSRSSVFACILLVFGLLIALRLFPQTHPHLTLRLDSPGVVVSPHLYGLMTEEINFSYDGGVYAELIRNRAFKDSVKQAAFWDLVQGAGDDCVMSLDERKPLNKDLLVSLHLDVIKTTGKAGIANQGYWGIPVRPGTTYRGSLFARQFNGSQTIALALESKNGDTTYASTEISGLDSNWRSFHFMLTTAANVAPTANAHFVVLTRQAGNYWFNLVSLFPPTFHDRPNGNRPDIMEMLAAMKPRFLRFPGGNYLEGSNFVNRFDWKNTLGPLESRAGHLSPWRYRSTDGLGLIEFLEWCEDLKMEPLVAVFAGFVLNKDYLEGPYLEPFVQDALDEIEYITGDTSTRWGAERARDGHPLPFLLHYVEIGNEDGFDYSGSYVQRYNAFYRAIKVKYPQLEIISTAGGKDPLGAWVSVPARELEMVDEHYYRSAAAMEANAHQYDGYDRKGPRVFVGEWATREGYPTTNFNAALGDAAWMTGLERNSDLVVMASYAPLLVNVNPDGMQWRCDLIGYDVLSAYGSPSYYAQQLFGSHLGNRVVPITAIGIPTQLQKLTYRDTLDHHLVPQMVDALYYVATRDSTSGIVYLKLVNIQDGAQEIKLSLQGAARVVNTVREWVLQTDSPAATNSISTPTHIVPIEKIIKGIGKNFDFSLPPYSIVVLELTAK
jgi:alpha-N-arabinofuranosidase